MARVASGEITLIDVADGDPAPRLSSRRLFKALTSVPQTPAATITWATNALSNIETGWSETSPTQQAISTTTVYFSDLLFSDTTGVATTTTATGTSPLPVTTFSGLVTYNSGSGAFAVDGGSITSIDGGNLATGTVTTDKITVASLEALSATIGTLRTATSGNRVEIKDNLIVVYDSSNTIRVKIGNLA